MLGSCIQFGHVCAFDEKTWRCDIVSSYNCTMGAFLVFHDYARRNNVRAVKEFSNLISRFRISMHKCAICKHDLLGWTMVWVWRDHEQLRTCQKSSEYDLANNNGKNVLESDTLDGLLHGLLCNLNFRVVWGVVRDISTTLLHHIGNILQLRPMS